jgi:hypothetical protein
MKDVIAMVEESAKSLATYHHTITSVLGSGCIACSSLECTRHDMTYLSYPPDVLVPVFLRESKVLVQTEAHIVAVETVCAVAQVQEVLLECGCDGRFAGCREAGEPDCEAFLLAKAVALSAREGRVPCDVAVVC